LYVSFLFGFLPAFLLKMFGRKSFIVGGLLITAAHVLAAVMITYAGNKKAIMNNSSLMAFLIAILGGQGASLIFIALLQTVMAAMSVVCTHFVAGLIVSYFFGSAVFFTCLANGMLGTWALWFIIIFGAIMFVVASQHLPESDDEEDGGLMGAAAAMTKGVLNKRTAGGHLLIQLILSILLVLVYAYDWEYSTGVAIVLTVFWLLNLAVPLALLAMLDEDAIKDMVGSPAEIETYLMMNKGKEGEQGTLDFWLFSLVVAFSIGMSFTSLEQAGPLALRNANNTYDMVQLQQVCTVAGATFTGFILLYGRDHLTPVAMFHMATIFSFVAAMHMWYLAGRRDQYIIQMGIFVFNGLALGTNFVTMASYCFEEYGKSGFAYTFGVMMTFAAVGFVIANTVIFQWTFDSYAGRQKEDGWHRLYFGNWSEAVAFYYIVIEIVLFIVGIVAHKSYTARQPEGGAMGAAVDAAKDLAKAVNIPSL